MSDHDEIAGYPSTTPRHSFGTSGLSFSSNSSMSPSSLSSGAAKAINECLAAWKNYLQILNNLSASGLRLAQTISTLEQWGVGDQSQCSQTNQSPATATTTLPSFQPNQSSTSNSPVVTQFINAWGDLQRATGVATTTVKLRIIGLLQEFITQSHTATFDQEAELQRIRDHNQQIILDTTQTMVNIQHQFCVASYDSFSTLMCCFICQAPVGFPHDSDCAMVQQQSHPHSQKRQSATSGELRSQTPSPHFGPLMAAQKSDRSSYYHHHQQQQQQQQQQPPQNSAEMRNLLFGSGSSSDHSYGTGISGVGPGPIGSGMNIDLSNTPRGPSPHQDIRGPSPIQGFLENIRGPLPNPGHLLGMKAPFRCSRSPLNFPLFPLNGQRRWSEAAAGEVKGETTIMDMESQMRRWSMPWEASKTDKNTVTWHQTRLMPVSKLAVQMAPSNSSLSKTNSDRSQSTTPDNVYQAGISEDGVAEAIQLLSCRPSRYQPTVGPPFIEEPNSSPSMGTYEMWSDRDQDRLPCINFQRDVMKTKDDQQQNQPQ